MPFLGDVFLSGGILFLCVLVARAFCWVFRLDILLIIFFYMSGVLESS